MVISGREARNLSARLRIAQAAVVHIYFGHIAVQLLPYLRRGKIPAVVSFHGADAGVNVEKRSHLRPLRQVFEAASLVLARSQAISENLIKLGCPEEKVRIHRTGIPLDRFQFAQRYAPQDGQWRLFQACRLIPKKGIDTTLRAFAKFVAHYPQAKLTVAGEGPLLDALQEQAAELHITNRVSFPGFVSQSRLRELLVQSHIFLHPSVTGPDGDREGVPNAMLEAMATGLPVVATWHGGIPEAIEHGETGLLAAEHDDSGIAEMLFWLASEPEAFEAMSANAARSVAANWEIQVQTRLLESIYDEARARG
jgi:colanic acid/amylovoran biosynthesis glycosyltransferase